MHRTRTGWRTALIGLAALAATLLAPAPLGAQNTARCMGLEATIIGTPGDDSITGTQGPDVIFAAQGDDFISGLGGDDVICGGQGDDVVIGGDGFDILFGAQGDDKMFSTGFGSSQRVHDGPDARDDTSGARMFGGQGNDDMYGSNRWDRMQGGPGDDQLFGYEGRDWLRGGPGRDNVNGGAGVDDVNGGNGSDRITVTNGDSIRGGNGADWCVVSGPTELFVSCGRNRYEEGIAQRTIPAGDYNVPGQVGFGYYRVNTYFEVNDSAGDIITNDFVPNNGPTIAIVDQGVRTVEFSRSATRVEAAGPSNIFGFTDGRALIGLDVAPGRYRVVPVDANDGTVFIQTRDGRGNLVESELGSGPQVLDVSTDMTFLDWSGTLQAVG